MVSQEIKKLISELELAESGIQDFQESHIDSLRDRIRYHAKSLPKPIATAMAQMLNGIIGLDPRVLSAFGFAGAHIHKARKTIERSKTATPEQRQTAEQLLSFALRLVTQVKPHAEKYSQTLSELRYALARLGGELKKDFKAGLDEKENTKGLALIKDAEDAIEDGDWDSVLFYAQQAESSGKDWTWKSSLDPRGVKRTGWATG